MRSPAFVCACEAASGKVCGLLLKHGALPTPTRPHLKALLALLARSSTPLSNGPWRFPVGVCRSGPLQSSTTKQHFHAVQRCFCLFTPHRLVVVLFSIIVMHHVCVWTFASIRSVEESGCQLDTVGGEVQETSP